MSDLFAKGMAGVTDKDIEQESSGSLIPAGDYNVQCTGAGMKTTKGGKEFFQLELTIIGPNQNGRKVFQPYWIHSANDKYNPFAQLAGFAVKAGVPKEKAKELKPADFVGLKAGARVKVEKNEQYGDKNVISHFKKMMSDLPSTNTSGSSESFNPPKGYAPDEVPF